MLYIIMLAAGYSRRFQGNKLVHPLKGKPLYQYTLTELIKLQQTDDLNRRLIVITQYEELSKYCQQRKVSVFMNCINNDGIASSIKTAIQEVMNDTSFQKNKNHHLLFCPADQPYLDHTHIEEMLKHYLSSHKHIGSLGMMEGKKQLILNPVVFHQDYMEELLALEGEQGGKVIVNRHKSDVCIHNINTKRFFWDIDERGDLEV